MIKAKFFYSKDGICVGFEVRGHSGFANSGFDIVCSAVSCAVQMCCNGITEVVGVNADIFVDSDTVSMKIKSDDERVQVLLESLRMEIGLLEENYSKNISLCVLEV
jgi:hypothetical protein